MLEAQTDPTDVPVAVGRALALMLLCWLLFGAGAIGLTYTLGF